MKRLAGALAALAVLATGCATQAPAPAPYCRVDRTDAPYTLTVSGPAGGRIAVDGKAAGSLVLADAEEDPETVTDAAPFEAVLYNVPNGRLVTVDGQACS